MVSFDTLYLLISIIIHLNLKQMATVKVGQVIKFKTSDGKMSGGTLRDVISKDGKKIALVNVFDGSNIQIPLDNIIIIKHQRSGEASSAIIKRTKKEVEAYNKELEEYGHSERENSLENKYKELQLQYDQLIQERNSLNAKINKYKQIEKDLNDCEERLNEAEEALEKAETNQIDELTGLKETVNALSSTILMLKSNSEPDAFEYLINRIKKFHNIEE